jgi:hypothetical protein
LGIFGEAFFGGGEQSGDGAQGASTDGFGDGGSLDVGTDSIEGGAGFYAAHFGGEEGVDQGRAHIHECGAAVLLAYVIDGLADLVHVAAETGLEECALIGEVLVEGADGDTGAAGDEGGGEALLAAGEQNLNGGVENGVHSDCGTGLDGRFSRVERVFGGGGQMRSPKLKVPSSIYHAALCGCGRK